MNRRKAIAVVAGALSARHVEAARPVGWVSTMGVMLVGGARLPASIGSAPVAGTDTVTALSGAAMVLFNGGSKVILAEGAKIRMEVAANASLAVRIEEGAIRYALTDPTSLAILSGGSVLNAAGAATGIAAAPTPAQTDPLDALKPTRERIDPIPPEFNDFRTTDVRPSVPSPSEPAQ